MGLFRREEKRRWGLGRILLFLLVVGWYLLTAIPPKVESYAGQSPVLRPETFFDGPLVSYGVVEDYRGRVIQRFIMRAQAQWAGDDGTMDEQFTFADGSHRERHWTFRKEGDRFLGTAPDVTGEAVGTAAGPVLHWVYDIRLPQDGSEREVHFDDWLTLTDANHLFSEVRITKYGIPVGRMTMFFEKQAAGAAPADAATTPPSPSSPSPSPSPSPDWR